MLQRMPVKRKDDAHLHAPLLARFRISGAARLQPHNVLAVLLRLLLQRHILATVQRLELLLCLCMLLPDLDSTDFAQPCMQ